MKLLRLYLVFVWLKAVKRQKIHFSAFIAYHYEIGSAAGHYFTPVGGAPFMNRVTTNILLPNSG